MLTTSVINKRPEKKKGSENEEIAPYARAVDGSVKKLITTGTLYIALRLGFAKDKKGIT